MILSIGEILSDMIGNNEGGALTFKAFCGGAPFNVAVNAKNAGAKVGFISRVGKDVIGRFVESEAKKANLEYLDIQEDEERNTTIAFVTLEDGERDFAFNRHDTADFNIEAKEINLNKYDGLNIVHLGSLMLSEKKGQKFAKTIIKKIRKADKILSFDVNFRMDLYKNLQEAIKAYKPFVDEADILKFSDDEIFNYTGKKDLKSAIQEVYKKDRLLLITLGSKGSMYIFNDLQGTIATKQVKPIDTTGAGDAFFGTVLAKLDGKEFSKENIENALIEGNKAGADATQFKGAIKL